MTGVELIDRLCAVIRSLVLIINEQQTIILQSQLVYDDAKLNAARDELDDLSKGLRRMEK